MTVNRALRELAAGRVLTRVRRAGTFVADVRPESTLIEIRSIGEEVKLRGNQHTSKVLTLKRSTDSKAIGELGLPADGFTFYSQIVHFENLLPIQYEERHVNPQLFPDYLEQDFSIQTPSEYMTRIAPAQRVQYWITAGQPNLRIRRLLRMLENEPSLVLHRRTWVENRVATDVLLWHPGQRYQLSGEF
jgi:GntR family histidine utilization transcriptional repressor